MLLQSLFLFSIASLVTAFPKDTSQPNHLDFDQRPLFYFLEQPSNGEVFPSQTQNKENIETPQQLQELQSQQLQKQPQLQQQLYPPGGFQYVNPELQYPGYSQQAFPRIQPSILFYGAGGQGQPILINPGSPPGNFLVPQQPGVIYGNNPQNPVFVGGYPNPKPAHIPPIEKDAEEIPTDPASIPPFPTKSTVSDNKPEKLETFNEDRFDPLPKSAGEADVFDEVDRKPFPQLPNRNNLKPGQRFFILNGQPLYQNYPLNYPEAPNFGFQQADQPFQRLQDIGQRPQEFNYNIPVQTVLLRNTGDLNQQPKSAENRPQTVGEDFSPNYSSLNQPIIPQAPLFRTNIDFDGQRGGPIGQFRFTPLNNAYFPGEEDVDNDSVIINANFGDVSESIGTSASTDSSLPSVKTAEPGTAQAAPSAVALAGPGGTAGAAPRGTALAGKGGLAVSSPQATAVAGTKKEDKEDKNKQEKQSKQERKSNRKPQN